MASWSETREQFDEHQSGQLRIGAQGDQLPLLPLPDAAIPGEHETTPAEQELERLAWNRAAAGGRSRREWHEFCDRMAAEWNALGKPKEAR